MKQPVYLFGPFVGELSWEFFRFAPYAIYVKKEKPNIPIIVFTRQSRFDLYGKYANILVPLRIPNDVNLTRESFKLESLIVKDYNRIARIFRTKYRKRYEILDHYYPDISSWRYKLKWQFPRISMDYDFRPRDKNKIIAKRFVKPHSIIVDNTSVDYSDLPDVVNTIDLMAKITNHTCDIDSTSLGCMMEALKECRCVVGNLESELSRLAILMNKPLICVNNTMSLDSINLLNPLETKIIFVNNIEEGIENYDDHI